jgi:hypothetical protein
MPINDFALQCHYTLGGNKVNSREVIKMYGDMEILLRVRNPSTNWR